MKRKIISFFESLIYIAIIAIIIFFIISFCNAYFGENIVDKVQEFVSNIIISEKQITAENQEIYEIPDIEKIETTEKIDNNENFNKEEKYYYQQLEQYSKIIYDALDANKENMKTGTYQINFGEQFSNLLEKENGQEILEDYYQTAIEAYQYDNPDVFYIEYTKLYLYTQTKKSLFKTTYNVFMNSGDKANYLKEAFSSKEIIDNSLEEIQKIKAYFVQNIKYNDYENIKAVHDYLVESIEYDETLSQENIYNLYGALINKKSVCEGYAESFKYLMDALQIPCIIVTGEATNSEGKTESHAWNYVQLYGVWYAIDCTWDDPIIIGPQIFSNLYRYKYFLKGENEFSKTHSPDGQFTKEGIVFDLPKISLENY